MSKLNKDQIDQLFAFVKSKYVRYYDVQLELVDHLASAIEEEMEQNSYLTFDQSLTKVYNRFPVTGFHHFVQEKSKGLESFWRMKFLNFAMQYFRLPKIILTFGLTTLLFLFSQQVFHLGSYQMNGLSLALLGLIIVQWASCFNLPKGFRNPEANNLLSVVAFKQVIGFGLLVPYQIILQFFAFPENVNWASSTGGQITALILSMFGVAIIIITDGVRTKGVDWIEDEIMKKYPEYFETAKS